MLSQEMARYLLNKELDLNPGMFIIPLSEGLGIQVMGENKDLLFSHPGSNLYLRRNTFLIGIRVIGFA
jgi:hypothetical protein